jgi:hypothetical protein
MIAASGIGVDSAPIPSLCHCVVYRKKEHHYFPSADCGEDKEVGTAMGMRNAVIMEVRATSLCSPLASPFTLPLCARIGESGASAAAPLHTDASRRPRPGGLQVLGRRTQTPLRSPPCLMIAVCRWVTSSHPAPPR